MAKTRIAIAKSDIVRLFNDDSMRIYRRADISKILSTQREFWRLKESETVTSFTEFLIKGTLLKKTQFKFPSRTETRYTWGDVPIYEVISSIKPDAYFSHYSAVYIHNLTDQIPKTIYLNSEQSPKPASSGQLAQDGIDRAFKNATRTTNNLAKYKGHSIYLLNGKHTHQLGATDLTGPDGSKVRVTDLERTLIDIVVRPYYSGGIFEVLNAYREANTRISLNRLSAYLKTLDYVYPYHQAIGFCLDRIGCFKPSQLDLFRKESLTFDFYLAHNMKEVDYNSDWKLFIPKGL